LAPIWRVRDTSLVPAEEGRRREKVPGSSERTWFCMVSQVGGTIRRFERDWYRLPVRYIPALVLVLSIRLVVLSSCVLALFVFLSDSEANKQNSKPIRTATETNAKNHMSKINSPGVAAAGNYFLAWFPHRFAERTVCQTLFLPIRSGLLFDAPADAEQVPLAAG